MMGKNKIRILNIAFLIVLLSFFGNSFAQASKNIPQLDDRFTYDIYFNSGSEQVSVVRNVKVVRFQEIGTKTFIVIKMGVFNLQDSEGFVLMDSLIAILPNREFKIEPPTSVEVYH